MAYFKQLGDGLLSALLGISRQAVHKARGADKITDSAARAVRQRLNLKLPRQGDTASLWAAATASYAQQAKALLSSDLKRTHRVYDKDAAAKELASTFGVQYTDGMTLQAVWKAYLLANLHSLLEALKAHGPEAPLYWNFGLRTPTPAQLAALANARQRRSEAAKARHAIASIVCPEPDIWAGFDFT